MQAEIFEQYQRHTKEVRRLGVESLKKHLRHIEKVDSEMADGLLSAKVASAVELAISRAADGRKKKWNGGHIDDGANMRFRLGMACSMFFRWAHAEGLLERNPYPTNSFRRPLRREAAHLTEEKVRFLFQCDRLSVADIAMLRFMLDTGLRVSELVRVKIKDIDFSERLVHLYSTKVRRFRTVPFSETTKHWLAIKLSLQAVPSEYLMSVEGQPCSTVAIRERFRKITAVVGFRVTPHMVRHTTGTLLIQHAQQLVVAQHLGHKDLSMTNHYIHLSGEYLRKVQDEMYLKKGAVLTP